MKRGDRVAIHYFDPIVLATVVEVFSDTPMVRVHLDSEGAYARRGGIPMEPEDFKQVQSFHPSWLSLIEYQVGDKVKVHSWVGNPVGTLVKKCKKAGRWTVFVLGVHYDFNEDELTPWPPPWIEMFSL